MNGENMQITGVYGRLLIDSLGRIEKRLEDLDERVRVDGMNRDQRIAELQKNLAVFEERVETRVHLMEARTNNLRAWLALGFGGVTVVLGIVQYIVNVAMGR